MSDVKGFGMKPFIEIRRNSDGVVRKYQDNYDWGGDYIWADGNYSCDCNRYLFFQRAADDDEDDNTGCSDGKYSVRITSEDGAVLYQDDEW
jgi:hypothetical protein